MKNFFTRKARNKFEYDVDNVDSISDSASINKIMNLRGSEGWELISATKNQSNYFCFYWKRSIK